MSSSGILRIASDIASTNPILAYELERSVKALSRSAVINPGVEKFEDKVQRMMETVKGLQKELKFSLTGFETAEEFSKFFSKAFDEEQELRDLLQDVKPRAAAQTAGIWDKVKDKAKKIFKGDEPEEEEKGVTPSYHMDESHMDDFVSGKSEWADPEEYIQQEYHENKDFFGSAQNLLKDMDEVRKKPSKNLVQKMIGEIESILRLGEHILRGGGKKSEPKAAPKPSKKSEDSPKSKDLDMSTVDHYVDMLKEHSGDAKKTLKLLKELFEQVKPSIEPERATISSRQAFSVLVRVAQERPDLRSVLLPHLARVAKR